MDRADAHLEETLEEMNERVYLLEQEGEQEPLIEAYVNRGSVLMMLGYVTSAAEDFESAVERIGAMEATGKEADAGTFVKAHTSLASLDYRRGSDPSDHLYIAGGRLAKLVPGSRHFDSRGIVMMCIEACAELSEFQHPEDCGLFVDKALSVLGDDHWSLNRRFDILCIHAEAADALNDVESAVRRLSEAIEVGDRLMEAGALDDPESLVSAIALRALDEADLGMDGNCIADLSAAIELSELLLENRSLSDRDMLVDLHQNLASALMKAGRIEEAERHMMRAMEIGIGLGAGSISEGL